MLQFVVVGDPAPQGSKKFVGNGRMIESSKKLKPWRAAVADAAFKAFSEAGLDQFTKPVVVDVIFIMPRPKTVTRVWPEKAPDLDKLQRSIGDALSIDSGILADDSLIVKWNAAKIYSDDVKPGAVISIELATQHDLDDAQAKVTVS